MRNIYTLIFCLLTMPAVSFAEEEKAKEKEPERIADVWSVTPKDGKGADFHAALQVHMQFRTEKNDPRIWNVYSPVTGDSINTYFIRACCYEWSSQDSYNEWSSESGAKQHWNENVHPLVESYVHDFIVIDSENSHWPKGTVVNYVGVTGLKIKNGANSQMKKSIKAMSKVALDHKWPKSWSWSYPVTGATDVNLAIPFANFADMAPADESFYNFVARVLKSEEEAGKLFEGYSSSIESSTYSIYRHNKELSMKAEEE